MFKLAVFTDTYDDINGVAVIYRRIVAAAERDSVSPAHVEVFGLSNETSVERGRHTVVHRYRPRPRFPVPRYHELATGLPPLWRMARDFERAEVDAVLVATPGPVGFLGKRLARRSGKPVIGFYHTRFPAYLAVYIGGLFRGGRAADLSERLGFSWMRWLYGDCNLVVCQSDAIADEVRRVTEAPLVVWETGVNTHTFRPGSAPGFRRRHGIPAEAPVALYTGRLAAEKNLDTLAELSQRLTGLHFLVVGDGPYAATLRKTARATFTGYLTGDDLAESYRAGDFFLFPSTTDTFGLVLLEALATGLPLVVVDVGAGAEMARSAGAGLTYPPGDLEVAAAALTRLANEPTERAAMARRARAYAEARDWSSALASFIALCRQAEHD